MTVPRRSSLRQQRLYQDIIEAGAAVVLADYLSVFPSFKNTGFLLDQLYGCNDISLIYVGGGFFSPSSELSSSRYKESKGVRGSDREIPACSKK